MTEVPLSNPLYHSNTLKKALKEKTQLPPPPFFFECVCAAARSYIK